MVLFCGCSLESPPGAESTLFLTWQSDPTTTMTIQWLEAGVPTSLPDRSITFVGSVDDRWRTKHASRHRFGDSPTWGYRAELTGLRPGAIYRFRVGDGTTVHRFVTAPDNTPSPVTFVAGGDMGIRRVAARIAGQAAHGEPLFSLVGGDIAYADGKDAQKWVRFLTIWRDRMVTPTG